MSAVNATSSAGKTNEPARRRSSYMPRLARAPTTLDATKWANFELCNVQREELWPYSSLLYEDDDISLRTPHARQPATASLQPHSIGGCHRAAAVGGSSWWGSRSSWDEKVTAR